MFVVKDRPTRRGEDLMFVRPPSRIWAVIGLLAVAGMLTLTAGNRASAAAGTPRRVGRAPHHPAGSKVIGSLSPTARLSVTIALKPRDPAGLGSYATEVSTPGSSVYHHYLTVAQFRRRFAPATSEVRALDTELRSRGLVGRPVTRNGLAIPITGRASAIAHALSISFERVRLASGRVAYANTAAAQFPASVAGDVQAVLGLDSLTRAVPLGIHSPAAHGGHGRDKPHVVTGGPQPCSAAVSDGDTYAAHTADELASAYRFSNLYGAGDMGGGQTVALFELEPYSTSDISTYQSCYGTSTSVSNVAVDGGAGSGAGSGEAALDIEDLIGLAPQVSVRVYEGPNSNTGLYDTYNQIVSDDVAKVISTSWGECESAEVATNAQSENTLFEEAATQGQSVLAAAGDSGSTDCGGSTLAVDDPASQPYVTGVGGTTLSAVGPPPTESVWNDGKRGGAGGGGISSRWKMPSYQSATASSLNVVSANSSGVPCGAASDSYCREVPDVSADANENTGYVIYYKGSWTAFGGTSAAAPLWAALTALSDASNACHGKSVGFANPALYSAAADTYTNDFNDITSGTNSLSGSGLYPAGAGYDMASGLGTPVGSGLPDALCGSSTPAVTLTTPANGSATGSATPTFAGAAGTSPQDSSTVTLKIYAGSTTAGSPVQTLTVTQSAGGWSVVPLTEVTDGTYTAQAQQTNTSTGLTGYSFANTFIVDTVAPVNALSLVSQSGGGSYYPGSGTTVYYQGSTAGSFKLQDAVSDSGSGPASSGFAALGGSSTGWTFTASTASTPAGGPYVSNAFSWASGASGAPGETVTGTDRAGNTSTTTLAFEDDSSAPTGSISYTTGDTSAVPVDVAFSASDGGSGVDPALGQLQRASAPLPGASCGAFGSFADVGPVGVTSPYSDSSVTAGNCYEYRYLVPDHVGNGATIGPSGQLGLTGGGSVHQPPVAKFSFSPSAPRTGQAVSFNATGSSDVDGTITSYTWTFGDGGTGSGETPTHVYRSPGNYTVKLTVTDNSDSAGTATHALTVAAPAPHVPTLNLRIPTQKLGSVLKRGLRVSASSSQAGSAKLRLILSSRNAKRLDLGSGRHTVVIASLTHQLSAGRLTRITVKLTRKARNHLRKVRRIAVTIRFTSSGADGTATVSRRLTLKR
jgi:hypothetical protein